MFLMGWWTHITLPPGICSSKSVLCLSVRRITSPCFWEIWKKSFSVLGLALIVVPIGTAQPPFQWQFFLCVYVSAFSCWQNWLHPAICVWYIFANLFHLNWVKAASQVTNSLPQCCVTQMCTEQCSPEAQVTAGRQIVAYFKYRNEAFWISLWMATSVLQIAREALGPLDFSHDTATLRHTEPLTCVSLRNSQFIKWSKYWHLHHVEFKYVKINLGYELEVNIIRELHEILILHSDINFTKLDLQTYM